MNKLRKYVEDLKESLRLASNRFSVYALTSNYNHEAKTLLPNLHIGVNLDSIYLYISPQVNYHDVSEELSRRGEIHELIRLNLEAIGYKAIEYLLEELEASDSDHC